MYKVDDNYSKKNLEKNSDFKINPHLRYYAIKKIFDEVDEEISPQLTKYYINKDKIEFSNSYIAFVLNNISDRFKKGYNIPFNIQKIINDTRFSNPYRQVYINFDDFYAEHDYAFKTEDEYFYYKIEDVEVNGYYLKYVFDILGHSIKIEISNKYKPVLFTNSDGEQAILSPIKRI